MVTHSGATIRADRLRPLNIPRPLRVESDERGWPVTVYLRGGQVTGDRVPVLEILDRWRIDDEWWRKDISRMYFRLVLSPEGVRTFEETPPSLPRKGGRGLILTIFHDLIEGGWFIQTGATPRQKAEPVHVLAPPVSTAVTGADEESRVLRPTPIRRVG